jgi:hypothetical protein
MVLRVTGVLTTPPTPTRGNPHGTGAPSGVISQGCRSCVEPSGPAGMPESLRSMSRGPVGVTPGAGTTATKVKPLLV